MEQDRAKVEQQRGARVPLVPPLKRARLVYFVPLVPLFRGIVPLEKPLYYKALGLIVEQLEQLEQSQAKVDI